MLDSAMFVSYLSCFSRLYSKPLHQLLTIHLCGRLGRRIVRHTHCKWIRCRSRMARRNRFPFMAHNRLSPDGARPDSDQCCRERLDLYQTNLLYVEIDSSAAMCNTWSHFFYGLALEPHTAMSNGSLLVTSIRNALHNTDNCNFKFKLLSGEISNGSKHNFVRVLNYKNHHRYADCQSHDDEDDEDDDDDDNDNTNNTDDKDKDDDTVGGFATCSQASKCLVAQQSQILKITGERTWNKLSGPYRYKGFPLLKKPPSWTSLRTEGNRWPALKATRCIYLII